MMSQAKWVLQAGSQIDCLLSLACQPHPATMLVTVQGPVLLAMADQWKHTHTHWISTPSHEYKWKKSISANRFNAPFCSLNARCYRPCFNECKSDRQICMLLSVNSNFSTWEPLSVFCWPCGLTPSDSKRASAGSWDKSAQWRAFIHPSLKR